MKLYRIFLIAAMLTGLLAAGCGSDTPEDAPFDSKLYITGGAKTDKIALKANTRSVVRSIRVGCPKPAATDVRVKFNDDASLVSTYNQAFYDQAEMLPAEFYELQQTEVLLNKGTVLSTAIEVSFFNLDQLSRSTVYVLPVTIAYADGIPVLESARTIYYVLKSSAMIEVVADLEKKNYVSFPSFKESKPSGAVCNNLRQFTLESLIRVHKFDPGIQTVMGVEEYFLLRISDTGLKSNQLQFVTPYGNMTSEQCMLTPGKWTHIAATYDMDAKQIKLYIDGVEVATKAGFTKEEAASFGKPMGLKANPFYIGYSYSSGRELDGEISECRIWNVVRTAEELGQCAYEVEPNTPGLVAYWKFNEGRGASIADHTGNQNDGVASGVLKWTSVSLPEVE